MGMAPKNRSKGTLIGCSMLMRYQEVNASKRCRVSLPRFSIHAETSYTQAPINYVIRVQDIESFSMSKSSKGTEKSVLKGFNNMHLIILGSIVRSLGSTNHF